MLDWTKSADGPFPWLEEWKWLEEVVPTAASHRWEGWGRGVECILLIRFEVDPEWSGVHHPYCSGQTLSGWKAVQSQSWHDRSWWTAPLLWLALLPKMFLESENNNFVWKYHAIKKTQCSFIILLLICMQGSLEEEDDEERCERTESIFLYCLSPYMCLVFQKHGFWTGILFKH